MTFFQRRPKGGSHPPVCEGVSSCVTCFRHFFRCVSVFVKGFEENVSIRLSTVIKNFAVALRLIIMVNRIALMNHIFIVWSLFEFWCGMLISGVKNAHGFDSIARS